MINVYCLWQEQITVKRRRKTYVMYENENEIIGNHLSKNQEKHLASHESNLQDEESANIEERNEEGINSVPSPEIVDYAELDNRSIVLDGRKPFFVSRLSKLYCF